MSGSAAAIWHDVECGSYDADLPLWEELAERRGGPVLELGCGTGRVALHLARRGHKVYGLDRDPALLAPLAGSASGVPTGGGPEPEGSGIAEIVPVVADAREFELSERVAVALAPMQLLQLLDGPEERGECLRSVATHLRPGGVFAAAIVEEALAGFNREEDVVPDTREIDGWVYASLPVEAHVDSTRILIRRLRKVVSPAGVLERSDNEIELLRLDAATLEAEGARVGLTPIERREVPPTLDHVGSTVVLLEKSS
ncbi:MAG: class I SAM-dependent methyltransferase [Solirubrobacterales bacterium]